MRVLDVIATRLRGSEPQHARAAWRLGSSLATEMPELYGLMPSEPVPAAVLVGLVDHDDEPGLLLTVRASTLRKHAGQISFPGGRLETLDVSPAAAALREAQEEIGLAPDNVEVLGFLPDHLVFTGYRVTPVIARLPPGLTLRMDTEEVEDVFELPWSVLDDDANIQASSRSFGGFEVPVNDIQLLGYRIWGLTASILLLLRDLARGVPA
jgi:8-oxo-dGTP pyrophosphatase MutT (NUDIX family)